MAETGAGADDPFLLSLAGASIGLFIFVVGGAAYLTFQEQQSKKSIEEEDTKPRLPTLAELEAEGVRDEAALMNAADMPAATNRNERRQNKKLLKKRVEPQQPWRGISAARVVTLAEPLVRRGQCPGTQRDSRTSQPSGSRAGPAVSPDGRRGRGAIGVEREREP